MGHFWIGNAYVDGNGQTSQPMSSLPSLPPSAVEPDRASGGREEAPRRFPPRRPSRSGRLPAWAFRSAPPRQFQPRDNPHSQWGSPFSPWPVEGWRPFPLRSSEERSFHGSPPPTLRPD